MFLRLGRKVLEKQCFLTTRTLIIERRKFASGSSSASSAGLFSIPELRQPSDFPKSAYDAVDECNRLRESLHNVTIATHRQALSALYRLDQISKTVCNVIDAAELCRSVHVDDGWRTNAQAAFDYLAQYIAQLNSDVHIYKALTQVTENASIFNLLTEEERRFATLLQAEFERDGIQLPDAQREQVVQLSHSTSQLEGLFSQNIVHSNQKFSVPSTPVKAVLPSTVLRAYGAQETDDNTIELHTNQAQLLQSLIRYSRDAELRRDVYMAHSTSVPENLAVLDALVQRRHELATALGFQSYAHRVLQDKMAQHPDRVFDFLYQLQNNTRPAWKRDMETIAQAKMAVEGTSQVEPWDISFYVGLLKARNGFDINVMSSYLTLDNCIRGMQQLVLNLFGMTMQEEVMDETESWDGESSDSSMRVRKFTFREHEHGDSLGTMYLDLHPRPGKYTHAAHFTVRCGCIQTEPDIQPPEYQAPVIALVCNLSTSTDASSGLSHSEVETLFHEFGHALHSLLSRTKFQHMSGTRAPMDFVETPSHLMENFVWDAQFLKILAVHPDSGEPVPDTIINKLQQSRNEFASIERQNQIIYALFDQMLFGVRAPETSSLSTTDLFTKLHEKFEVPHAQGTHWHSRFGHLVTYGAGYYGYLYSQVFAGDIWNQCFQKESLSSKAGHEYWQKILIHGGAKDPTAMLTDMLGRAPKADFFLQAM